MDIFTPWLLTSIAICATLSVLILGLKWRRHPTAVRLPPGPYPLPIIGNFLQFKKNPLQSLDELSKSYGPLISLKFGTRNMVIVSSPELAREVLSKHDVAFSGRFLPAASEACDHNKYSIMGTEGRKLRKICKEHLFSMPKLEATQSIRQHKLWQLYDHVKECCIAGHAVQIEDAVFLTTLNTMSAMLLSLDMGKFGSDALPDLKGTVQALIETMSAPNLGDFFPFLKLFDLQGIKRRGELSIRKFLKIIDEVIQQRSLTSSSPGKDDMLQSLLDLKNNKEYDISYDEIKHLLLELLAGGADVISTTVEWAMTELLLNPNKMATLKDELRTIIGKDKQVKESDISRLPYLQAVMKEVFRCHPPGAFLQPRKAKADTQFVNGYTILKDTEVLINTWGMGRDSRIWPDPHSFEPERFLDSNIGYEGRHFELLPFGSGRQICPGMSLGIRMIHLILAFLFHNFDWELEQGITEQQLKLSEKFGFRLRKMVPLRAVPLNNAL